MSADPAYRGPYDDPHGTTGSHRWENPGCSCTRCQYNRDEVTISQAVGVPHVSSGQPHLRTIDDVCDRLDALLDELVKLNASLAPASALLEELALKRPLIGRKLGR